MNVNLDIKEIFSANKTRAAYGIGDYAICLYWSGVSLYLLYFYTDVVGISPLMAGWIYDQWHHSGHRRPCLYRGRD